LNAMRLNPRSADPRGRPRRYLFTGGGTGGHVYPSLVVADYIRSKEPEAQILFAGVKKGAEERIVPARGYDLVTLTSQSLPRRRLGDLVRFPLKMLRGVAGGLNVLMRYRPDVIFGTGGYAAAPIVIAALLLRYTGLWRGTILIHEQNIIPGRTNLWLGRMADAVAVSFRETSRFFPARKTFLTGYPVRREIERPRRREDDARALWGLPPGAKVLVAFGGSSGARVLNRALWGALGLLLSRHEDLHIYHAIGRGQTEYDPEKDLEEHLQRLGLPQDAAARYHWRPYFDPIEDYYAVADLLMCRAGAGTVWEIAAAGIPALLIPKARLPGDHQVKNARFLERSGAARVLYERALYSQGKITGEGVRAEEVVAAVEDILYSAQCPPQMTAQSVRSANPQAAAERIYRLASSPTRQAPAAVSSVNHGTGAVSAPTATPIEWLSAEGLLAWLQQRWKERSELSREDLAYIHYKADHLLHSGRWQERNTGVKIAGLSRFRERVPLLVEFITDRTPTTRLRRLLGGDFVQVGFIRRNSLQALWRIGVYNPSVRRAFLFALTDPYYEVRSWAARALCRMAPSIGADAELESLLRRNLKDRWFEVIVESAKALAQLASDPGVLEDLELLLRHNNWKVRDAALFCLKELLARNVLKFSPELEQELERVQVTCLDFAPLFPIRKTLEDFQRVLYERKKVSSGSPERMLRNQES
jgi:UDP-N-acetylglucosamine--N-acetylmuramyl-(pentapeptide) pyrophosphoryl-undecaprenol N-acetylglucosamine transferase